MLSLSTCLTRPTPALSQVYPPASANRSSPPVPWTAQCASGTLRPSKFSSVKETRCCSSALLCLIVSLRLWGSAFILGLDALVNVCQSSIYFLRKVCFEIMVALQKYPYLEMDKLCLGRSYHKFPKMPKSFNPTFIMGFHSSRPNKWTLVRDPLTKI